MLLLFAMTLPTRAGEATTDHFTVSDLETEDDYTYFVVSLEGSHIYTAYNLDIHLPNGVSPLIEEDIVQIEMPVGGIYPTTGKVNKTNRHGIGATWNVVGNQVLRIVCNSQDNAEFTANTGVLFYVYVNVRPYAKAGNNQMTVDMANLIVKENAKQYDVADAQYTLDLGTERSLTLNISANNKWSTCVLPFAAALPTGVQAYSCSATSGDYLLLDEVTSLAAYQPYILYATNGYTGQLSGTANAAQYVETATAGLLNGAVVARNITAGYVLQNQGSGARFYNVNGADFNIPEGRCWLTVPNASRSAFGFVGDDATAVGRLAETLSTSADVYDLEGRCVATPQAGHIYIIGGRKVMKMK